jgi:membrane-associated phospholipid phosphatase
VRARSIGLAAAVWVLVRAASAAAGGPPVGPVVAPAAPAAPVAVPVAPVVAPAAPVAPDPSPMAPAPPPRETNPRPGARPEHAGVFASRPVLEWSLAAAGGAVWLGSGALFKPDLAPTECRWCGTNAFDEELRGLRWSDPGKPDLASDVISYGVMPIAAGGLLALAAVREGRASEIAEDFLIAAEATVAAGLIGEAFRFATARERPSVRALSDEEKDDVDHPEENNLSFISGHVATSFALAVSSGTIATLRHRRMAPLVWATGLSLAAATSYLRVASDEHYATDVLAGVVAGAAIGLAAPLLHRRPGADRGPAVTAAPVRGGGVVLLVWR